MGPFPKFTRLPPCDLFGWIRGEGPELVDGVPLAGKEKGVPIALAGMLKEPEGCWEPGWPCWGVGPDRGGTKPR